MSGLTQIQWGTIALLTPLAAAMIIGLVPSLRKAGKPAAAVSLAAVLSSLVAAIALFAFQLNHPSESATELLRWLPGNGASIAEVGLRLDAISVSMLLVVTIVASCVQVFSLSYMAEEPPPAFGRYFAYHSLFVFAMSLLVLAPNMLQLFAGWELVGLTSYLLIGFYFQKPSAARAALKAFWVTKAGDVGLLLGILLLYRVTGGFSYGLEVRLGSAATAITLLFFLGAMGKSAQFPLHIWLPDAMEGPTPVSALLHAATMVAAGVFLIVRADPLFVQAPITQETMLYVGAFTALFAASVAVVQEDIKKVLAYSTCSQLGYMIAALGAGSVMAGFFHLGTHAFFKALLFLAAGSVIHAVHSNNLSDMGGLRTKMKLTTTVFIIGSLALAGVPPFAGFFSKDQVLEAVAAKESWLPLGALMVGAFLTAFYMGRVVFLTFFGKPSEKAQQAHEAGPIMAIPLLILSAGAVGAGFFGTELAGAWGKSYEFHMGPVGIAATVLGLLGIGLSYLVYGSRTLSAESFAFLAPLGWLARSSLVDRAFEFGFRRVLLVLAGAIGWFDRYIIDGLMNVSGYLVLVGGERLRAVQTGNVQHYVYAVIVGAILLTAWGLL